MRRLHSVALLVALPLALAAQSVQSLTTEEAGMVRRAATNLDTSLGKQRDDAVKEGSDTDSLDVKIAGSKMLVRAMENQQFPVDAPSGNEAALRKWLFIQVTAISAVSLADGQAARNNDTVQVAALDAITRKMGAQYDAAVKDVSDDTLKGWGYFSHKFDPNLFKADPTVDKSWSNDTAPIVEPMKSKSPAGALQVELNVANGDTISGEKRIKVQIDSKSLPTKAELYVGDELRSTSESRPFFFVLDTMDESDGDLKIKVVGYDETGNRAEFPLTLKVDNQVSKGADFHIARGRNLLAERDFAGAQGEARLAIKADSNNNDAKLLMASASYERGQVDIAEKYASDVESSQPDNLKNNQLLASINAYKVFDARATGDPQSARQAAYDAITANARYRRKVAEERSDTLVASAPTPIAKADAYIAGYRYSLAIEQVRSLAESSSFRDVDAVSRYAYCLMKAGRYQDVAAMLDKNVRFGQPNNYLRYLNNAVRVAIADDSEFARGKTIMVPVPDNGDNSGAFMKTTVDAYAALRMAQVAPFEAAVTQLRSMKPTSLVARYYQLRLDWANHDFDAQQSVTRDVMMDDILPEEILLEEGIQFANQNFKKGVGPGLKAQNYKEAQAYFNATLEAKPDSAEALTGMSLLSALMGNNDDLMKYSKAATEASPRYAMGWMAYSLALKTQAVAGARVKNGGKELNDILQESVKATKEAVSIDPRLGSRETTAQAMWTYFIRFGRTPVLPSPLDAD